MFESVNPTNLARCFNRDNSSICVLRCRDRVIVDVNAGFERVTGLQRQQVLGKRPGECGLWQDDQQERSVLLELSTTQGVCAQVLAFHAANGEFADGVLSCEPFDFAGEAYFLCITQDVHVYPDRERAFKRPMQSYKSFFMDSAQGLFRKWPEPERGFIEVNNAFAVMFGYASPAEMLSAALEVSFCPYVDLNDAADAQTQLATFGKLNLRRVQIQRPDGSRLWIAESIRAVFGREGQVLFVEGSAIDISELISAQDIARQTEALRKVVVENASEGVFLIFQGIVRYANPALALALGYAAGELTDHGYMELVHQDDRPAQSARRALRAAGSREAQHYEVRLLHKNGAVRLFEVRAHALDYRDGVASTGTMRDVTDERASAMRVQRAEERYRLLFQNAGIGLFQTDLKGQLREANPALLRMFGFDGPEQMRKNAARLSEAFADPLQRMQTLDSIERGETIENRELRFVHRDGHEFWVSLSARLIRDQNGTPVSVEGSMQDISARRLAELQLKFQANHDHLTRLPNRVRFEVILGEYLQKLRASGVTEGAHAVLLLDLDGFKVVNDSLGHAAGDELLVMICERLLRDLPDGLVFSRYGGDEFAIVTRSPCSLEASIEIAERVLGALSEPFSLRSQQIFSSASIGIARMDASYIDQQHVMRDGDTAMYRAKATGKGRYEVFDDEMHRAARERLALQTDLRFGLDRDEFFAYYQPIIDLSNGNVVGAEALVRWEHPRRGLLLPASFIAEAEESGLLVGIDWFVLDQACKQFVQWQAELGARAPLSVSVNVSDRLFASRSFVGSLADLVRRSGLDPSCLNLEITETVFRGNRWETLAVLQELKSIGVKLLVDDFGTGYSSLVSFADAAFDGLKIDRGFLQDLETNVRHRAVVKTICQFAQDLQLRVIAEGIERDSQADILLDLGCELGQGFRYAPALSPATFSSRIATP